MKKYNPFFTKNFFMLAILFAFTKSGLAQEDFIRGVFVSWYYNVDFTQLRDSLHLNWAHAWAENGNTKILYVLQNDGYLNLMGVTTHMFNKPKAQRMVFEAEQAPDPLRNYFIERNGVPDQDTLWRSPSSPGYMVKSPVPDNEYNYKITHYTASFILKRTPSPTGNPPVVRLEAVCKDDGSILNQRILYNNDFSGNDLETKTLEFDLTYNAIPVLEPQGVLSGEPQYITSNCSGVDIRVYWYGNATTWLDKVIIEDDDGINLFSGQWDAELYNSASSFQSYPLMKRFYFFDEPYLSSFLAYKYVEDVIPQEIPGITTVNQYDKLERFLLDAQPLELMIDPYTITMYIPSPAFITNADSFGIAPYTTDLYYNTELQSAMQNVFIDKISDAASLTIPNGKNFYVVPQLHGTYFERNGKFISPSGLAGHLRPPTGNEVTLQCNLAIAYGAKGIIPYCLTTERIEWEGWTNFPGLLTSQESGDGILRNHWTNYGLFYWNTDENPNYQKLIRMGYKDKWDALANINSKLISIGPTLMELTCDKTYSIHLGQPTNEYITSITTTDAQNERYVELGLFNKAGEISSEYFYIVNRRTLQTESRDIEVHYDKTESNPYNLVNWTVREMGTDNYWSSASPANQFTTTFEPGDGKLFKLQPTIIGGGSLIYNETISNDIELYGDLTIENDVVLTVNADYHCYGNIILNGGTISGNGKIYFHDYKKIIVYGTSGIYGFMGSIELDFVEPNGPHELFNGIEVNQGASFIINECIIRNAKVGITIYSNTDYFLAFQVQFYNCVEGGIIIYGSLSMPPNIVACEFNNLSCGLLASNLSEILVRGNQFINNDMGINLLNVAVPLIDYNSISSNKKTLPGIFLVSCNGAIRNNNISGHTNGIHLGNSSPDIGVNQITNNLYHGIYVGIGSMPKMNAKLFYDPPLYYPTSGYNQIWENGGTTTGGPLDNDGSEIYFNNSNAIIRKGCNSIYDDREGSEHPPYNTRLLMNGIRFGLPIFIQAEANFWSDNPQYPLRERFGNLIVDYDPFLLEPCEVPGGGGNGEELFVKSSTGEIIDTLYPIQRTIENLTSNDLLYAVAEEKFITADYISAEEVYNQIVNSNDSLEIKLTAYQRLYELGKLASKPESYFNELNTTYTTIVQSTSDSLMMNMFTQLGSLSLIGEQEYVEAIDNFDNIVQQNPGSEKAVLAEIDAFTTALLLEEGDTTLGKTSAQNYIINSLDYGNKISSILKQNFGSPQKTEGEGAIPVCYNLYQNYPNPFNPATTIKYDLVENGNVKLSVYDILGREIVVLVNEQQQPGSYQVSWDASGFASGIYFYSLTSGNYAATKKLILLK